MKKKIIITGGGTGGHIFPGINIAVFLLKKGWEICWVGSKNRLEHNIIPKYNIKIKYIHVQNVRKEKKVFKKIAIFLYFFISLLESIRIIFRYKPHIVLGTGSYISLPCSIAAWICQIPLIIHEQNVIPGTSNKLLSLISTMSFQGFSGKKLKNAKIIGNPVSQKVLKIPIPEIRLLNRSGPTRILVLGGSQGSKILNYVLPKVAKNFSKDAFFFHQSGTKEFNIVNMRYKNTKKKYKVVKFIKHIDLAYNWCDIVISRAGAMSISEISSVGIASILIPIFSKDQHQYYNAKKLEDLQASFIVNQKDLNHNKIIKILKKLSRSKILFMSKKARLIRNSKTYSKIEESLNNILKI